jgi:hypothetical protein
MNFLIRKSVPVKPAATDETLNIVQREIEITVERTFSILRVSSSENTAEVKTHSAAPKDIHDDPTR